MQPEEVRSALNRQFGLEFGPEAFADCRSSDDLAERLRGLNTDGDSDDLDVEVAQLQLCETPGWGVPPTAANSRLTPYLPQRGTEEFWESLRRYVGIDRWPSLEAVSLLPIRHAIIMSGIPPVIFVGVYWFMEELTLAALISVLIAFYLVAFGLVRRKERRFKICPAELTARELAEQIVQRRRELRALDPLPQSAQELEKFSKEFEADSDLDSHS